MMSEYNSRAQNFLTFNLLSIGYITLHEVVLILDYFFLKYEGKKGVKLIHVLEKATIEKPSLTSVKLCFKKKPLLEAPKFANSTTIGY